MWFLAQAKTLMFFERGGTLWSGLWKKQQSRIIAPRVVRLESVTLRWKSCLRLRWHVDQLDVLGCSRASQAEAATELAKKLFFFCFCPNFRANHAEGVDVCLWDGGKLRYTSLRPVFRNAWKWDKPSAKTTTSVHTKVSRKSDVAQKFWWTDKWVFLLAAMHTAVIKYGLLWHA